MILLFSRLVEINAFFLLVLLNYPRMNNKFDFYRFQLVPVSLFQGSLFSNELNDYEYLKKVKNEIFETVIVNSQFSSNGCLLPIQKTFNTNNIHCFLLSNFRRQSVIKNFERTYVDSQPYVVVVIDNNSDQQIIAVSRNSAAYSSSKSVINILGRVFSRNLEKSNLEIHIEPIIQKGSFWKFLDQNHSLSKLSLSIVKPNLANISNTLPKLRSIGDNTNSHKTTLSLEAPINGVLENITRENEDINGIIDYCEKGGGTIHAKARVSKNLYKSEQNGLTVEVNFDFDAEGISQDNIKALLENLLQKAHL